MDVFLERESEWTSSSVLSRIAVSVPMKSTTIDGLITEAEVLNSRGIRYVSIRRQQVFRMGELAIQEVLCDYGIGISSLGFAGGFTGTLGLTFDRAVDDVRRATDLACELGARFLVVLPGNQGLHTYNHAEKTVRLAMMDLLYFAERHNVQYLVPTDTVFGCENDTFRPRGCALQWLRRFGSNVVRPLIVVRGTAVSCKLPNGWRNSLGEGGCLRVCDRCNNYQRNSRLLKNILSFLTRNGGVSGMERLVHD